jgi:5-methylcytosine-specific restriction endonuclease McrA
MYLSGKAEIVSTYSERVYHSIENWCGNMPAVIRLKNYITFNKTKVKFSRINVFGRDSFTCSYCKKVFGADKLTYDHVTPKSRGGKTCWENIVTSCFSCNERKADRTPEEAGMCLFSVPVKPTARPNLRTALYSPNTPEQWKDYLFWTKELE